MSSSACGDGSNRPKVSARNTLRKHGSSSGSSGAFIVGSVAGVRCKHRLVPKNEPGQFCRLAPESYRPPRLTDASACSPRARRKAALRTMGPGTLTGEWVTREVFAIHMLQGPAFTSNNIDQLCLPEEVHRLRLNDLTVKRHLGTGNYCSKLTLIVGTILSSVQNCRTESS